MKRDLNKRGFHPLCHSFHTRIIILILISKILHITSKIQVTLNQSTHPPHGGQINLENLQSTSPYYIYNRSYMDYNFGLFPLPSLVLWES